VLTIPSHENVPVMNYSQYEMQSTIPKKIICQANSALSSRNEATTAALRDVTSCSPVHNTNNTDECVIFKVNIAHRKMMQPVGIQQRYASSKPNSSTVPVTFM
jgi:hypothetical protein